ncbi:endonuclease-reverse transcriptase [Plakobranchus ocellatus]|uniref:Endonuclease-reverse transcriptase n=1 Tax=Plakobranchus ocellatus TaxID=259542 RepID=A0AAV3ZU32_9GAST|nr:endonuclease-reverse transcriptase [Plakobranchus ocellatus]
MLIFLYACESWTLNADIERRIRAMEMRCYRRLLGISYKDHTTYEEVSRRIENAIRLHVDLLTIVRQRKLKWYGHTTRSSGLAQTIMQGIVNGGRRRGRQKKRWEENIREWTGLELRNTLRKAEDREEWKAMVRRSSAAPRRIPDLRDR